MIQTQTKKVLAAIALVAVATTSFSGVSAATTVGTATVTGSGAFDTDIIWDDNFPGIATASIEDIKIKARVLPSLNMEISAEEIDLGVLTPGVASNGSVFLEVGTNSVSGVSITARSQNAGLTNLATPSVQINALTTDGVAESYTWASTPNVVNDASNLLFAATGLATAVEVINDTTEHVVYTTNKAEATNLVDDVEFVVTATTTAETPAGDYEDFATFTVIGNF
ncbi:hypothetical protein N9J72_02600 [Candidatus Gracilibacteria bacterium]|nr:hypothetical protein [Candidatus Gracilibacteria bacterium]